MTYDPNRDPYNPRRPVFGDDDNSTGTAIFIGALVLLALVFGGVYFYANDNQQVASDMTITNSPVTTTQPRIPTNPSVTPPANVPTPEPMRSPPAPAPSQP